MQKMFSFAKKALKSVKYNEIINEKYDNSVALTPPMGWSSWNLFRNKINEDLIYETAKAIKDSGLSDCGYKYINIDDCWQSSMRDKNGKLQGDLSSFPSGIKSLVEKVNSLGLKLGIYSSNGTLTCEDLPASLGKEAIDADTFAEWGIEYFKYDFCHNIPVSTVAPKIGGITITDKSDYSETEYSIYDAELSGDAEIINDKHLSYISGLSSNAGACEFKNVSVPEAGEYILTITVRKSGRQEKHLDILVNSTAIYRTDLPGTKSPSPEGKHQILIRLNKGENTIKLFNSVASRQDSASVQYSIMGNELKRATREYAEKNGCEEKPIIFSICEWGRNFPWKWGSRVGNLWRTTPDIMPKWFSILGIYEFNVLLYKYADVGSWNDPDMLEVGNGNLTYDENKSHFTLWCMMAAPLILGNDVRKFIKADGSVDSDNPTYKILTNKNVIAINQDRLGVQCRRVRSNGAEDILVKPLENGDFAVCLFNKASSVARMECSLKEISALPFVGINSTSRFETTELWNNETLDVSDKIETSVPPHGVKIYRVKVI